jgi:hypothetical protein
VGLTLLLVAGALAQAAPLPATTPDPASAPFNPDANALFDRDPAIRAWAIRFFDRNRDGWLTSFEAQPALAAFKVLADADHDGHVTVREFNSAKAFVDARTGAAPAGPAIAALGKAP